MEASCLVGDGPDACFRAGIVEKHVAAVADCPDQVFLSMAVAPVTMKNPLADQVVTRAEDLCLGIDNAFPQGGHGGHQFERGTGRIKSLDGPVEPGPLFADLFIDRITDERGKVIEVVGRPAGQGEDFAGLNFDRHQGTRLVAHGLFSRQLDIDIERDRKVLAFPGLLVDNPLILKSARIDGPDFTTGPALQMIIESFFQTAAANLAGIAESQQGVSRKAPFRKLGAVGNKSERMGGRL